MASKKKLLQAAAGSAGGGLAGAYTLDNISIVGYGAINLSSQDTTPHSVFFKPDGTKMYMVGRSAHAFFEYDLSTAWDISTASYLQSFSFYSQSPAGTGVFFKSDGLKLYYVSDNGDAVYEYDLSTAWDISTASYSNNTLSTTAAQPTPTGLFFKSDGTEMYMTGSSSDKLYQYTLSTAWDVSTGSYTQSFNLATQESSPYGISFKSDGTKFYVCGVSGKTVLEYDMSTAWDISTATYNQEQSVSETSSPRGIFFKPDGSAVYIVDVGTDKLFSYSLSTNYDISTISWNEPANAYKNVQSQDLDAEGIFFKPDGTKLYYTGRQNDSVYEYNLSTAWDVSTATYSQAYVITEDNYVTAIFFKDDGTKMYALGDQYNAIYEYSLSTAWDVSTASYSSVSFSLGTEETNPKGMHFTPTGTKVFVVGEASDAVWVYNLSTAWDLSTASIDFYGKFILNGSGNVPEDIAFKTDGTKVYVLDRGNREVEEYNLSTAWDLSTATYSQAFSTGSESITLYGLFFKSDGTKMFLCDRTAGSVWEYSLSTAWDVTTASAGTPNPRFYLAEKEGRPEGSTFKTDGTKMYIVGHNEDTVFEYNLSTAWDVTSASYSQSFSVQSQDTTPSSVRFKTDGTKMFVMGATADAVLEYTLTTAWDISTASYSQSFSVSSQETLPRGLDFKTDGTKMYVVGLLKDIVYEYTLSTAWDVSTASLNTSFSVKTDEASPGGVTFKSDGTRMYVVGYSSDRVRQYTLSTAWDVSSATLSASFSVLNEVYLAVEVNFKSDGTKMFVLDESADAIIEYDLSTAWDVSTASFAGPPTSGYYDFGSNVPNPHGLFFKPDGTKFYAADDANNRIAEYNLSTAWDIDTASSVQEFSVNSQETSPRAVHFKTDGTEMYVSGISSDAVHQYTLSTAWDISSASFTQTKSVADVDPQPNGLFFKSDGTKMFIVGAQYDAMYEFTLSTAWDISTATYNLPADSYYNVSSQENRPTGLQLSADGTKMFIVGFQNDTIYEYTLATGFDLTSVTYEQSFSVNFQDNAPVGIFFKDDGSALYMIGNQYDAIWKYDLTA